MAIYDLTTQTVASVQTGDIINIPYSGAYKTITLPRGKFKLECWGAQGGNYSSYRGGTGGYSTGTLVLTESTTLNIYSGGQPATNTTDRVAVTGGWNGGGNGFNRYYSSTYTYGQGGGGGSDIRINSTSLHARVIVAGGGGGSANMDAFSTKAGGGLTGKSPEGTAYVGEQTSAGAGGSFGQGGSATTSKGNYKYGSGGGGGGWYGGGGYNGASDSSGAIYRGCNGGGSGYVYTSTTATNYPSGCLLNSTHYLTEAQTLDGTVNFPSYSGGTETGHAGNGACKITVIEAGLPLLVKRNGVWVKASKVYRKASGSWVNISASEIPTYFSSSKIYEMKEVK